MRPEPSSCPFCESDHKRVFLLREHAFALWDGFPVSGGHVLIVPARQFPTSFDASPEERVGIFGAIETVCDLIRSRRAVDGFNLARAGALDIAVAFVLLSGVERCA